MKDKLKAVIATFERKREEPWEKLTDITPFEPSKNIIHENAKKLFEEELYELRNISNEVVDFGNEFYTCW
jgi:hypothetical protein